MYNATIVITLGQIKYNKSIFKYTSKLKVFGNLKDFDFIFFFNSFGEEIYKNF